MKRLVPLAKVYSLKIHQSQYAREGLFPRSNPACGPQCTMLFSYKRKNQMPPGTSWRVTAHSVFTLNSLCSPGIHYPAKDARVRLCPLQRQTGAHPPWSQNKPPLSFPLLQSKVAFKRRNSLRFCLSNSQSPRGKGWEQSS